MTKFDGALRSVRSRSPRSGELTLTAIKLTFTSAAGATMNVGKKRDGGHSLRLAAVSSPE